MESSSRLTPRRPCHTGRLGVDPELERPFELNEKRESVRVTIFGEEYPVTAPASAEYINQLAGYVDRKMRDVTARTQSKQAARIAVLAALNIAHELFSERRDKESQLTSVEAKAQDLLVWMDQKLAETPDV